MRFSCQEVTLGRAVRTLHAGSDALFNTCDTVLEFLLGNAQVLVGVGQVLDFLVELLLDLRELLDAERVQVDWEGDRYQHVTWDIILLLDATGSSDVCWAYSGSPCRPQPWFANCRLSDVTNV